MITILDRLGDWNPQLFRELKGRLKAKNLLGAAVLSLLSQVTLYLVLNGQFPEPKPPKADVDWTTASRYCTGEYTYLNRYNCVSDGLGYWQIDWKDVWFDLATWCGVVMFALLILGGVYLLMSDVSKERQRGTLNFIRLTPQPSESVLLGKLLGVPILVYFGVALVVPLQIWSVMAAGVGIDMLLRFYVLTAAGCALFYNAALVFGLLGGTAWLGCLAVGVFMFPAVALLRLMFSQDDGIYLPDLKWFSFNLGQDPNLLQVFIMGNCLVAAFWLWRSSNRRFRNPNGTILSKQQSYYIIPTFQVLFVGFDWGYSDFGSWSGFALLNLLVFLGLIAALTPDRKILQTWSRYKHMEDRRYSAIRDWVWGENSPILVAIAINLAMTAIIWMPGLVVRSLNTEGLTIVSLLATANLIFIYAAIAQLLLLLKTKKRHALSLGAVTAATVLPPIVLVLFARDLTQYSGLWLSTVFGFGLISAPSMSLTLSTILLSFLGQVLTMGALSFQIHRVLKKAGESEAQKLLQEHRG